MFVLTFR